MTEKSVTLSMALTIRQGLIMRETPATSLEKLVNTIKSGNVDAVKKALSGLKENQNFDINAKYHNDRTALHYAARYGTPEMVQALIEAGAEVDARGGS